MARGRSSDIRRELRKVIPESVVNDLAETGAVQRQRRVRIYELVWVLVLGFAIGRKRTLAALRRSYERETGQTIEESSFYKRFSRVRPPDGTVERRLTTGPRPISARR